MTDKEAQEDELLALASIFDTDIFSTTLEDEGAVLSGGQFIAHLDLPSPFSITIQDKGSGSTQPNEKASEPNMRVLNVRYLPPITLFFELPVDYPSKSPPQITLACKWLTLEQLSKLCQRLDEVWYENEGDVILFTWTSFLKDELLDFLQIQSPLDLTKVVHSSRKHSQTCDMSSIRTPTKIMSTESEGTSGLGTYDRRAIQDIASQSMLLPTILEFDKLQREKTFLGTVFTCQVCFMEKLGSLCMSFTVCNHVYCKDCMRGYFEVQIGDGNVQSLSCPHTKCESIAHPAQVKELVSDELFQRYDRLLLQSSLDGMPDIMYCPRKQCASPVMVDTSHDMGSCPVCHYSFCIFCKLTYHGISPCRIKNADALKIREEYNNATPKRKIEMERRYGRRAMQQIIEESYSSEYLEKEARKCPNCSTWISKIDGCNKMTCTKCHTYFCWLCQDRLPKLNPYSHFNRPGVNCFNQLFQGVQDEEEEEQFLIPTDSDDSDDEIDQDYRDFLRLL